MKKIKLSLEDLEVESFTTTPEDPGKKRGTVVGFATAFTCNTNGCHPECTGDPTVPYTCPYTCDDMSCNPTCGVSCGGSCPDTCEPPCPTLLGPKC